MGYLPHSEDVESQILEMKTASAAQDLENRDVGELVE